MAQRPYGQRRYCRIQQRVPTIFDDEGRASLVPLGIGRDVVLDRAIVDKSARIGNGARLVNRASVSHQDGPGYFIRNGIVVAPKDSTIPAGFEL